MFGKPSLTRAQFDTTCILFEQDLGIGAISKMTDLSLQAIYRIRDNRVAAEAALKSWGL